MPARIQSPVDMPHHGRNEKCQEHDRPNRNIHHKEAMSLKLALGSLLAPKRPFTPSHLHSSSQLPSGAATPAFGPTTPLPPPPPPHSSPINLRHYPHHPPSRLGTSDAHELEWPSASPPGSPDFLPTSTSGSSSPNQKPSSPSENPPPLSLPDSLLSEPRPETATTRPSLLHAPKPVSAPQLGTLPTSPGGSGTATPRVKFIEKLESKSAWDALIHGSFS